MPIILTEQNKGAHGTNAICACGFSKAKIYQEEQCTCGNPYDCKCKVHSPPQYDPPRMSDNLLMSNRPMLLWTVSKIREPKIQFIFAGKIEQEVFEEVNRLNKEKLLWEYKEEEVFNAAVKSEYRYLMDRLIED